MNKICYGCGVTLQSVDEKGQGYVPEKKIQDAKYCMRCFRMTNYGENSVVETPKDVKEIINKVNKDVRFVLFLVDYLNINDEIIKIFSSIKKRKVLIVNKCELLPKSIKRSRIEEYLKDYYKIKDPIILKGGKNNREVSKILKYLEDNNIKETYILGLSNSGKSSLINNMMDILKSDMAKITVNKKANTTLDFIRVNINNRLLLIDSPGFILNKSLNHDTSSKNITAYSMQMKICETVGLLDNEYFLKFDGNTPIVLYTNAENKSVIKKYYKAAPGLTHTIKIEKENTDIVLYGIGFVTIKKPVNITTNISLENIEIRPSMFGGKNE